MSIEYRPGKKDDCGTMAELINIASAGVVEYLFQDLVPGMSPVQVVAQSLEKSDGPHSYRSALVAADGNRVVGMTLSYPSSFHEITQEMKHFFPADRLHHLEDFYAARIEDSWYIDALGVLEGHRRQGIGEQLIALTKEKARKNRYNALSLIVFADNKLAIPVYERTGFKVVRKVKLDKNRYIKYNDGCLLMKCDLPGVRAT